MTNTENYLLCNSVRYVIRALIPDLSTTDYSALFILMGIIMYYCNKKEFQCIVILVFSILCYISQSYFPFLFGVFMKFLNPIQLFMILAIPFILLYNGERGKENKWMFYIYYPLHMIILNGFVFCISS